MQSSPRLRRRHLLPLLGSLASSGSQASCVKALAWSEDPPHAMRLGDGNVGGVEIVLHQALMKRLGCELRLVEMPFARALLALQSGEVDVLPATLARPERQVYARFSRPLMQLRNAVFVRRDAATKAARSSLTALVDQGWRVGGQVGAAYGSEFVALQAHPDRRKRLVQVPYRDSLWRMLDRERVDAVIANELTGMHDLKRLGLAARIGPSGLSLPAEEGGSAWSRKSTGEDFVERFNLAIEQLRQSGEYAKLVAPFGVDGKGFARSL